MPKNPTPNEAGWTGSIYLHQHMRVRFEEAGDVQAAVRDALTDLRHWCDAFGADLDAALDGSYQVYLEERALGLAPTIPE